MYFSTFFYVFSLFIQIELLQYFLTQKKAPKNDDIWFQFIQTMGISKHNTPALKSWLENPWTSLPCCLQICMVRVWGVLSKFGDSIMRS